MSKKRITIDKLEGMNKMGNFQLTPTSKHSLKLCGFEFKDLV